MTEDLKSITAEALAFMAGTWTAQIWDGTFEETWSTPLGGTMQGIGRHHVNGKVGFMEFMSIEPTPAGLLMFMVLGAPSKGACKPVPFVLCEFENGCAVFVNEENEYPTHITYEMGDGNTLKCRIEGVSNGDAKGEDFAFKRVQ
jgi:hypothetical protein